MTKKPKRIILAVTETQLRQIATALENDFRMHMGQRFIDLVDDLCFQNIEPDNGETYSAELFDKIINRRDQATEKLQEFFDICFEKDWRRYQRTDNVQIEIDMWSAIRHWFWSQRKPEERGSGVDSYPPMQFGSEPLPEVRLED